jgi:hypothetical protein
MTSSNFKINALLAGMFAIGCSREQTSIQIRVTAKTAEGKPVSGAVVNLDGENVGETNAFGEFKLTSEVKTGKYHKLMLAKDDPRYYFAPHIETFKAKDNAEQIVEITPTMYVVPKPRFKNENLPSTQPVTPSLSKQANVAFNLGVPQDEEKHEAQPLLVPLPEINSENKVQSAKNTAEKTVFITAHVYAGRLPLADARLTWIGSGQPFTCMTNERGRCTLKVPEQFRDGAYVIAEKKDYLSKISEAPRRDNENIRFSMQTGENIVVHATKKSAWTTQPLADAEIRLSGASRGKTNSQGVALVDIGNNRSGIIQVTDPNTGDQQNIPIKELHLDESVEANFADTRDLGWKTKIILPPRSTPAMQGGEPPNLSQPPLMIAFREALKLTSSQDDRYNETIPAPGVLNILPILHRNENNFQIYLIAIDATGPLRQSAIVDIKSPDLASSWAASAVTAYNDLMGSLMPQGIVTQVSGEKLTVNFAGHPPRQGEQLGISIYPGLYHPNYYLQAKVVDSNQGKLKARIQMETKFDTSHLPWEAVGAAARITRQQEETINLSEILQFKEFSAADRGLILAKKYLAENNPLDALKSLDDNPGHAADMHARNNMKSDIYLALGDISSLQREQTRIMKTSIADGQEFFAELSEANILRMQAQSLPVIEKEPALGERLSYLAHRADAIYASIKDPNPQLALTLQYTKLVATRKKAECEDDIVTLASLSSQLNLLESLVHQLAGEARDKDAWSALIKTERSKISMTASDDIKKI